MDVQKIINSVKSSSVVSLAEVKALVAEIERLRESYPKICDACFTSSWRPVPPGTPGAVPDNVGDWMVCGYCQLVEELKTQP